jgi:hypothetical protein
MLEFECRKGGAAECRKSGAAKCMETGAAKCRLGARAPQVPGFRFQVSSFGLNIKPQTRTFALILIALYALSALDTFNVQHTSHFLQRFRL